MTEQPFKPVFRRKVAELVLDENHSVKEAPRLWTWENQRLISVVRES